MALGELVFANILDRRVHDAQGIEGPPGIYTLGKGGHALPFIVYRAWKVPQGAVPEEIRFFGPSGRLAYRWGPVIRRMAGSMDLTEETDLVDDAFLPEAGTHLASFILQGEIVSELEVPVFVQEPPAKLPKEIEEGLRKSDVIWVGPGRSGATEWPNLTGSVPVWFAYKQGRIYVLSQTEPGPQEQTIPGIPGATELTVTTRRKGRDTSLDHFPAAVRILEGPEFEQTAAALVDRRRSRVGPPEESLKRWRTTCVVAELTPIVAT